MDVIQTKFYGPTKTKPSRIVATVAGAKRTFRGGGAAYQNTLTDHHHAAIRMASVTGRIGLGYGKIVSGSLRGICVHVFTGVSEPRFNQALRDTCGSNP